MAKFRVLSIKQTDLRRQGGCYWTNSVVVVVKSQNANSKRSQERVLRKARVRI